MPDVQGAGILILAIMFPHEHLAQETSQMCWDNLASASYVFMIAEQRSSGERMASRVSKLLLYGYKVTKL